MSPLREIDDVVEEFLVESRENLDRIDADLLALEQGDAGEELLASIFRSMHTIKGTCGFLGLSRLETVAHRGENLLSLLRDGAMQPTPPVVNALLESVDAIREILGRLEATGEEGPQDYAGLLAKLERLASGQPSELPEPLQTVPPKAKPVAVVPVAPMDALLPEGSR